MTAPTVAKALITGWIATYGVPTKITTDQGVQFDSHLFDELMRTLGTRHFRTTAYHPQANGIIERWHRTLKSAILCHNTEKWTMHIPIILLGLRSTYKEDLNATPAELVFGTTLRIPGEFFDEQPPTKTQSQTVIDLRNAMRDLRPTTTAWHSSTKTFVHGDLQTATHVFLRDDSIRPSLTHPYNGPFEVLERTPKYYRLRLPNRESNITIDRLKPAFMPRDKEETNIIPTTPDKEETNIIPTTPVQTSNEQATYTPLPTSTKVTRSGRHVKIPDKYR